MIFYHVIIDAGRRKRYACGCLAEVFGNERTPCTTCGTNLNALSDFQMFYDKTWIPKMYMSRDHYADFSFSQILGIVSEKAKAVLAESFSNAVDFGDIEMVSFKDLTDQKIKEIRDYSGSASLKKIVNDPPQYYRLLVKQGADIDFETSKVKLVLDCPECGRKDYERPYDRGFPLPHIIESTWKGYDLFYLEGTGYTLYCTERFIEVYKQVELTGLEFVELGQTV